MASNRPANDSKTDEERLRRELDDAINFHQNALDDLVSANSLFTIAVFVGLTFSSNLGLGVASHCKVPDSVARSLLVYEVISFACYLLSSLVAKALKMHLYTYRFSQELPIKSTLSKFLRGSMLTLSLWGSIFGCIFLTMSMVDVIEIRLGKITCGHKPMRAAGTLIAIVAFALTLYIPFTMYAIYLPARRAKI